MELILLQFIWFITTFLFVTTAVLIIIFKKNKEMKKIKIFWKNFCKKLAEYGAAASYVIKH